jgi:hypothetical protein
MLNEIDLQELKEIGLNEDTIEKIHVKSISVKEAIDKGFYLKTKSSENALSPENVSSCLFYPILEFSGEPRIDIETKAELGLIKPRWKEGIELVDKAPKYLGLPKSKQTEQVILYPPELDLDKSYVLVTEGPKKVYRAYQEGFPTVGLSGVWNFTEGSIKESHLISELLTLIEIHELKIILAFDSDQSYKKPVMEAQNTLANLIYQETGKLIYKLDLPQAFKGEFTKGLDDFLQAAEKAELEKLIQQASVIKTDLINSYEYNKFPIAPLNYQPEIFRTIIKDLQYKQEGPLEILSQALHCASSAAFRNKFTLRGKKAHLNTVGLAKSSVGKSDIAKEGLKAFIQIDLELTKLYKQELQEYKNSSENTAKPKTHNIRISKATQEGLTEYLTKYAHTPAGMYFALGEFETHLANLKLDRNMGLASFYTELFDGNTLSSDITKTNLALGDVMETVSNMAVGVSGLSTYQACFDNLPKRSESSGFIARYAFYLGTDRGLDVEFQESLSNKSFNSFCLILSYLEKLSRNSIEAFNFSLSSEAKSLWSQRYKELKQEIRENGDQPINSSLKRKLTDYGSKFALIFEIVNQVHQHVLESFSACQLEINPDKLFLEINIKAINLERFYSHNLFTHKSLSISLEALEQALKWTEYFMKTDKYIFNKHFNSADNGYMKYKNMIIQILTKYPQGLAKSQLRNQAKLPRTREGKAIYDDILAELKESWLIEVETKNNSEIIRLKKQYCGAFAES